MCGLGDAVWYMPFVKALRAQFPTAEIVVVVASEAARVILEASSDNIEIIVFDRGGRQRGWRALKRLFRVIRSRRFDVAISGAHPNSTRVPLFAFVSGAKITIGANFERLSFLYTRRVHVRADAHYFDRYCLLLAGAGVVMTPEQYRPTLQPPLAARDSAIFRWSQAGLDKFGPVVGIASGADINSRGKWKPSLKRWSNEGYAEVAKWATRELGARVVMFGGPDEVCLAADIANISGVPIINFCGKTQLGELQWMISRCSALVANDTGIMHLAGALGTPVVALFGPTDPYSFKAPGGRHRVVQGHAHCSPCYPRPTCELQTCVAMANISPSQVIDSISHLLCAHKETRRPSLTGNPIPTESPVGAGGPFLIRES